MKKKNERELWDKTDVKIFILFLLDNLQYPLDLDTLNRIVHETGYVGGFDFAECFSELLDDGHIIGDEVAGVAYYQVSATGRMVAKQLQSELLDEIREESMICAARLLSLKARGASLHTSVEPREDGQFLVKLAISDANGTILETTCAVPSERLAEKICRNFERKPEMTFRGLLSVLTGEIDYLLR